MAIDNIKVHHGEHNQGSMVIYNNKEHHREHINSSWSFGN